MIEKLRKYLEQFKKTMGKIDMNRGYTITDFDGTGMLEIQKVDELDGFNSDEEAVQQAIKDGIEIIPEDELPVNFDRKYLGWIDTQENRRRIGEYCNTISVEVR